MNIVYGIIGLLGKYIDHFLKDTYLEKMTFTNEHANIAIDQLLFCHCNDNTKIWVIGLINTRNKDFRTEIVYSRDSDILKKIVRYHIGPGNNIITDWMGTNDWMDNNPDFNRIIHIQAIVILAMVMNQLPILKA